MNSTRHPSGPGLQQRTEYADDRQQQQDNGTNEFQPVRQQGDQSSDARYTLAAYLERARQRGDMPMLPPASQQQGGRPDLRLAK